MRILLPIIQTLLSVGMLFNWFNSSTEFSLPLFALGFLLGITAASWISYLVEIGD